MLFCLRWGASLSTICTWSGFAIENLPPHHEWTSEDLEILPLASLGSLS
jgi:hypothetical protein